MKLSSGHTAIPLEAKEQEHYNKLFPGAWNDVVRLQPDGWILTKRFLEFEKKVFNFKFRPDDVLVMTYPKCGTTWTQEIVWNMRKNPNLDHPDADDALFVRSPYIELDMLFPAEFPPEVGNSMEVFLKGIGKYCTPDLAAGVMFQVADAHKGGRTLKTHLPFSLLPKNLLDTCKVVYVARNPKDNVLSAMHHYRLVPQHGFSGTQHDFIKAYVDDILLYSPYGTHLKEAWQHHDHPNFHWVFFEDLKADIAQELKKLDRFLGTGLTEEQMLNVTKQTSFKTLQEKDSLKQVGNYNKEEAEKEGLFFRKGEAGSWKGKFSPEEEAMLDDWTTKNLAGVGINFKYQ